MQVASNQGMAEFCQAIFNRHLNSQSICPANHEVSYHRGWFYFDDDAPFQCPEWTEQARRMIATSSHRVLYWPQGNCYVIDYNPEYGREEEAADCEESYA